MSTVSDQTLSVAFFLLSIIGHVLKRALLCTLVLCFISPCLKMCTLDIIYLSSLMPTSLLMHVPATVYIYQLPFMCSPSLIPFTPSPGDEDVPQEERYPHLTRQYGRSQTYDADDDVPPPLPPRPPETLNHSGGESEDSDEDRQGLPPPPPPNTQPPGNSFYNNNIIIIWCVRKTSSIY